MIHNRSDLEEALRFLEEKHQERDREERRRLGAHLLSRIAAEHERKQEQHQAYIDSLRRGHGLDKEEEDGESKNDY